MTGLSWLLSAIALIALGGLFAAIDAAVSTVSLARVQELVREERPGAVSLLRVMAERPRYINLVVLLRITCEITATVLLVLFLYDNFGLNWALFGAAAIMVVTSFVVIGVGPRTWAASTPTRLPGHGPSAAAVFVVVDAAEPAAGGFG